LDILHRDNGATRDSWEGSVSQQAAKKVHEQRRTDFMGAKTRLTI
jgi:hypothetical protein